MLNLSEITEVEPEQLMDNVSPALRFALERQMESRSETRGSFKSFINGPKQL
ncbi:hypothetical protein OHB12_22800 [Nocardia sp. NBC_01730]|uniref:hypothetical protein n=1 Tax=Nocardia sp. NBC_01730 TaxID=2975998 RepID=UPI002E0EDF11|nr:hypothetical protein OHB12_22800 [Nocardia sp. NBC_01730]